MGELAGELRLASQPPQCLSNSHEKRTVRKIRLAFGFVSFRCVPELLFFHFQFGGQLTLSSVRGFMQMIDIESV